MPKKYRRKPQHVEALKTYIGQPMTDIRDFLLGSSVFVSPTEHGCILEKQLGGVLDLTPGDYILRYDDGQVTSCKAVDFEKRYEEDHQEALEVGLAHALFSIYGYSVDDALRALSNKDIRNFLLASLETRATSHLKGFKTVNHINFQSNESDVDKIVSEMTKRMGKEFAKSATGVY